VQGNRPVRYGSGASETGGRRLMPIPPITRDAITAALKECGPMSVMEIVEHTGMVRSRVNACLSTARANHPGKFFRIVSYRTQAGVQGRETPVYAAGPGRDATRPVFDRERYLERRRSYYQQNRAQWAARRKVRTGQVPASPWDGLVPMGRRTTKQQPAARAQRAF